ncbi:MAG: 2Fe-2S iron-sulfur cluster-binding protein [Candidatus Kapaibacteriota bacterium]
MFRSITVSAIKRLTPQAVAISFSVPEDLREEFSYAPGQYITLKIEVDGQKVNRAYSLCSSPFSGEPHTIGVKQTEQGLASTFLNTALSIGDTLQVMKPMGNFTLQVQSDRARHIILIGGGSGITPLLSIAKSALLKETQSKVTLIYGNKDQQSIMFRDELNELSNGNDAFTMINVLEDSGGDHQGILNKEMLQMLLSSYISENNAEFFICGPSPVMAHAESVLEQYAVPKERIHREFFTAPLTIDEESAEMPETSEKQIAVTLYGKSYEIVVNPGETILEAGIRQQLDPPYACQIAACCTCRAKLRSGQVHMDSREALTDDEIEEGYILTCQAHPLTDDVIVDFDG